MVTGAIILSLCCKIVENKGEGRGVKSLENGHFVEIGEFRGVQLSRNGCFSRKTGVLR
jgi:hypothetical protein